MSNNGGRVIVPELLDALPDGQGDRSLKDIVRINRYLGGYRVLDWTFAQMVRPGESFTVLDVGAASGDMGAAIQRRYPRARITSLDYKRNHLAKAGFPKLQGNAFQLPFAPASFDFVFNSLFLHHFPDSEVVSLLTGFRIVARRGVVAIDLERGPLGIHFVPATRWLFGWDRVTLFDAPTSVRAAFKRRELLGLAHRAGLASAVVRTHRPWARLSLIAPVTESPRQP